MENNRRCQAPFHVEGCSGIGNSLDHFTPQCIALILGWTKEKINSEENLQWLSKACHTAKDATTDDRKKSLLLQKAGIQAITFQDVRKWAGRSSYNNEDKEGRNVAILRKVMLLTNHGRNIVLNWPYEYMRIVYNRTSGRLEEVNNHSTHG